MFCADEWPRVAGPAARPPDAMLRAQRRHPSDAREESSQRP